MNTRILALTVCALGALCGCDRDAPHDAPAPHKDRAAAGIVDIDAAAAMRAGVRAAPVRREHLARLINAPAEVVLDPDRTAHLSPLVDARIERVDAKLGDRVQAGARLAGLRSVAAGESRAGLAAAENELDLARNSLHRQEQLRASGIGAERSYQEASAASRRAEAALSAARERKSVIGTYEMRSPIAGTVIERHATVGEAVAPLNVLFTVADLEHVWVVGQVYERDVETVRLGARATLTLEAYPGRALQAALSYVGGTLQHETRTLPVRIELDNTDGILRPGLFGSLAIEANDAIEALALPPSAVQRIGTQVLVFVLDGEQGTSLRYRAREVVLGRDSGAFVEIKSGLREGERVAVSGTFTLRSEMLRDTLTEED